jgi:hypothetical protein
MAVTRAQKRFLDYYIEQDFKNASEAYLKAYPEASYDTARANSTRLLARTYIQEHLSATIADVLRREKVPLEKRIFDYWMRRAFYDITEIIDTKGNMRLDDGELRERGLSVCIDSINKKTDSHGNVTIVYKFADKDAAAEHLQQYIQMIKRQSLEIELAGPLPLLAFTEKEEYLDGSPDGPGDSLGPDSAALEAPAEAGEGAVESDI